MNERLYRSRDDRMLAGVAGGLAERFDLDPSLVRVLWVILVFVSGGLFLLAYVAMAIVVPEEPLDAVAWPAGMQGGSPPAPAASASGGITTGAIVGWGAPAAGAATAAFSASTPPEAGGPGPASSGEPAAAADPGVAPDAAATPTPEASPAADGALWPATPPPATAPPAPVPPAAVPPATPTWAVSERRRRRERRGGGAIIGGIVLVLLGGYFLLRTIVPELDVGTFWPVVLIAIGIALLIGSVRPGRSPDA